MLRTLPALGVSFFLAACTTTTGSEAGTNDEAASDSEETESGETGSEDGEDGGGNDALLTAPCSPCAPEAMAFVEDDEDYSLGMRLSADRASCNLVGGDEVGGSDLAFNFWPEDNTLTLFTDFEILEYPGASESALGGVFYSDEPPDNARVVLQPAGEEPFAVGFSLGDVELLDACIVAPL